MAKPDPLIVKRMLLEGRASDLLALLEGESPYSRDDLIDNLPGKNHNREKDMDEKSTLCLALYHVRFVSEYGLGKDSIIDGDKIWSTYPDAFNRWLEMGCLGLHKEEVDNYINANPLSNT